MNQEQIEIVSAESRVVADREIFDEQGPRRVFVVSTPLPPKPRIRRTRIVGKTAVGEVIANRARKR